VRAAVASHDSAVAVDDVALRRADLLCEPPAGVAVGDEADVVAVGLLGDRQPALGRFGAHEGLGRRRSEREVRVRELLAVSTPST
jgi:single-stranded DNA-specific DHH superfamily exonuclease